ncbi:MAG: hypothetical protein JOZ89_04840 [Gammaproteobacteria bacterium]|nr:hypothetical protein [Gammaproteobacteria bacterium]
MEGVLAQIAAEQRSEGPFRGLTRGGLLLLRCLMLVPALMGAHPGTECRDSVIDRAAVEARSPQNPLEFAARLFVRPSGAAIRFDIPLETLRLQLQLAKPSLVILALCGGLTQDGQLSECT